MLEGINADLMQFADGAPQADDITMLALQYKGKSA
jgi:serine phosphatase RsbU (regulator of sigma subunit)